MNISKKGVWIVVVLFLLMLAVLAASQLPQPPSLPGSDSPPSYEIICGDGIDNDGDGSVDCSDSDCSGSYDCGGAAPGYDSADADGTYPDAGGTYPDADGTYPDAGGTYPETGGTYPETGGTYPDAGYGTDYAGTDGAFPETPHFPEADMVTTTTTTTSSEPASAPSQVTYGDITGDGCVNLEDIWMMGPMKGQCGMAGSAVDVDGDGCFNDADVPTIVANVNLRCTGGFH